ncbi:probable methyltransferase-like protein 25 [Physella acuta]|uniref:probable methyltransferase-like protein 25 n=1 Tax=Physella acuta TaxID=109671 RepID=UPI0027DE16E1|nr:probable methyltransferase-like protein 25 [Physella acuta]
MDKTELDLDLDLDLPIRKILTFLAKYENIHNFPLTDVFKNGCLKKMPTEWADQLLQLTTEELNNLPFLGTDSSVRHPLFPPTLHKFLHKATALSLNQSQVKQITPLILDTNMARGMNPKKVHEVSIMAPFIHEVMKQTKCNLILDVGSGLGYLDHVLHQVYGHRVVGLEISDSHISSAETRALNQGINCEGIHSVKFKLTNDAECLGQLEEMINKMSSMVNNKCPHQGQGQPVLQDSTEEMTSPAVCLIGLHCCGDLSTSLLTIYTSLKCVKAVCCVCCCYHKMAYKNGQFVHFPISQLVRSVYTETRQDYPAWQISPYTLRVGAQQTRCSWKNQTVEQHSAHTRHVAYRGLLELTDMCDPTVVRKKIRKCDFSSFSTFLDSYFSPEADKAERLKLMELYENHSKQIDMIEIFTCLQVVLQPVIETLVYLDRVQWLVEQGHPHITVSPIFDDALSPRNLMIKALKLS